MKQQSSSSLGQLLTTVLSGEAVVPLKGRSHGLKIYHRFHFSSALKRMSVIVGHTPAGSTETHYMATVKGAPETLKEMVRFSFVMRCKWVNIGHTPAGSTETHYMATVKGAPEMLKEMVRFSFVMRCKWVIVGHASAGSMETLHGHGQRGARDAQRDGEI